MSNTHLSLVNEFMTIKEDIWGLIIILSSIFVFFPILLLLDIITLKLNTKKVNVFTNNEKNLNYYVEHDIFGIRRFLAKRKVGKDSIYINICYVDNKIKSYYIPKHVTSITMTYGALLPMLHESEKENVLALLAKIGTTKMDIFYSQNMDIKLIINDIPIKTVNGIDLRFEGTFQSINMYPYIIGASVVAIACVLLYYYLKHGGETSITENNNEVNTQNANVENTEVTSSVPFVDVEMLKNATPLLQIMATSSTTFLIEHIGINVTAVALGKQDPLYITQLAAIFAGILPPHNNSMEMILEIAKMLCNGSNISHIVVNYKEGAITIFWYALQNQLDLNVCLNIDDLKEAFQMVQDIQYRAHK